MSRKKRQIIFIIPKTPVKIKPPAPINGHRRAVSCHLCRHIIDHTLHKYYRSILYLRCLSNNPPSPNSTSVVGSGTTEALSNWIDPPIPSCQSTAINTILPVTVPAGALFTVVDAADKYVPYQRVNFDTMYVDVLVSHEIYFEVVAEDGATIIKYQLKPNYDPSDAYVTSDVYLVDQTSLLISLVPAGLTVNAFLGNLVASPGASWQLYDKLGYERNDGTLYMDDKLVVTAEDGASTTTYYLSVLNEVPNYLAYVVSDVYLVSEDDGTISGVSSAHSVTDFEGNVTASEGATMEVQNSS